MRGGELAVNAQAPHRPTSSAEDNVLLLDNVQLLDDAEIAALRQIFPSLELRLSRDDHDALARISGSYRLSLAGRWGLELDAAEPADRTESAAEGEGLGEVALKDKDQIGGAAARGWGA